MEFAKTLFQDRLRAGLSELGINLPLDSVTAMAEFAEQVVATNKTLNLTRLVEPAEMAIKNFVDSLSLLLADWPEEMRCLDLGTGAGFPGIPLAIAKPAWEWVLLDATRKRLNFIAGAAARLGIKNVTTCHARAEDMGREGKHRESYQLVVSRAVAELPVLLELGAPFVELGGALVAYKGSEGREELAVSERAQAELGLALAGRVQLELPMEMGERNLLLFRKAKPLGGKYPRRAGMAQKRPLL